MQFAQYFTNPWLFSKKCGIIFIVMKYDLNKEYAEFDREGAERMNDTLEFTMHKEKDDEMKSTLETVYRALVDVKKGYNPINQIVGYILSEDPTYITTYNNARSLIRRIDRDELLQELVKSYLGLEDDK